MAEVALPEIRLPWHNPHERPSDAALIAHYPDALPDLITNARAALLAIDQPESAADDQPANNSTITETLGWRGLPWRWSWAYELCPTQTNTRSGTSTDTAANHRALAYLVPAVAAPEICVPLTYDMYEAMPKGVATTVVRQGITLAREIGDYRWAEWAITQPAHLDEVLAVVRHKATFLAAARRKGE